MTLSQASRSEALPNLHERNDLVMSQLPEVHFIARRIHKQLPVFVPLEDLVHSGVLGLLEATQKYDSTTNVQFKTFAQFRIRGAILDSLRELDHASRRMRSKSRKLNAASEQLSRRLGRQATEEEIARELGLNLSALRKLAATLRSLESVDAHRVSGENRTETRDLIESASANPDENPFAQCLRAEVRQSLVEAISTLPQLQQQILSRYYFEQLTIQEIASSLGMKNSRISQIHAAAIAKLRTYLGRKNVSTDPQAKVVSASAPPSA